MRWSTQHALKDTLKNLAKSEEYEFVKERLDIDTGSDFECWQRAKNWRRQRVKPL